MSRVLSDKIIQRNLIDLLEQILVELKILNTYNQMAMNEKLTEEDLEAENDS